jgi:GcrA cell cycle regulator
MTRGHQTWTEARDKALAELWEQGLSAAKIADKFGGGVTRNAVIGRLNRLGLQRGGNQWSDAETEQFKALWAEGKTDAQIGEAMGKDPRAIGMKRLRLKLPVNRAVRAKAVRPKKPRTQRKRKTLEGNRPNVIKGVQGAQKGATRVEQPDTVLRRLKDAETANPDARRVPIEQLQAGECRWAVNDAKPGEDHLFCGAKARAGSSYCKAHQAVSVSGYEVELNAKADRGGLDSFLDQVSARGERRQKVLAW